MFYLVLRDDGCLPLPPALLAELDLRPGDALLGSREDDSLILRPASRADPAMHPPFLPGPFPCNASAASASSVGASPAA